jgi:type IV pilus assembly protein PilC
MKEFSYKAKDKKGRSTSGSIKAGNRNDALTTLKARKYTKIRAKELKPKKDPTLTAITWGPFGKIPNKDILIFTKKLSTMVRSGLTILDSLNLISSQTQNVVFRKYINEMIKDINVGMPFSDVVRKHPVCFDSIFCNMIEAGEISGKLDEFLDRIVDGQERMEKIRSGIKSALFYPVTLIVVTILIVWAMLIFVVPTFQEMYAGMGIELPGPTQMIINASDWIMDGGNFMGLIATIVGIIFSHRMLMKNVYPYRASVHGMMLKLPLFGNIIIKSTVARLSLLMANLFAAGIGVEEILKVATNVTTNTKFIEAMERINDRVVSGSDLSNLFAEETVFPLELSQLIKVGERTGNMDEMLASIARYYQEEFEAVVSGLTTIIEPVMIVFVGGMIGVMVVALYLPIFSAGDAFA